MIKSTFKRFVSVLLAIMIVVFALSAQVFAYTSEDESDHQASLQTDAALLDEVKNQMDVILDTYLGERVLPREDVENIVWELSEDDMIAAWEECGGLSAITESLNYAEIEDILLYESTETFGYFYETLSDIFNSDIALFAASGTYEPVEGVTVSVSGATDNSMSGGAVTVTAKGSAGFMGLGASSKTATITVYNDSSATATLSFDWTATSVNQLKIDGTQYTGTSGSFSKVLDVGKSFVITITTATNSTTNKLVMNNFAIAAAQAESDVTFEYDSGFGSVTVGGAAINSGDAVTISKDGASVAATPASGAIFLGWINTADNIIISTAATYTLQPADNMTVKAVFTKTTPYFLVNGNYLYEGLGAAMDAVADVANKTVVLANNATLPAGDYTIPSGVTLLIPFDAANTLYTTAPGVNNVGFSNVTAYRTLTMASGANITVNGAISLSAMQASNGAVSCPYGPTSFIKMESDSTITVNSGANLYVWGYIMGSGSITVKNGGTVYEDFQVTNWRGGTNTSNMVDNTYGVFPMNQYYVQNVEVPMTLEAGAVENGYMSVQITLVGIQGSAVPFIGPNGMFDIISGSITKDYDESTDRLVITINGEIRMQSLSISMKLSAIGTKTINSQKYELPVTNNLTVYVNEGSKVTITQDIAMLPGSELIINSGAECILGEKNNIYLYDADEWVNSTDSDGNRAFFATQTADVAPLKYAPGKPADVPFHTANADASVHVAGTIDASQGYVYVTASGANVTAENGAVVKLNPGTQTITYQVFQTGSDGKTLNYVEIPIKPISLIENDTGFGGTYEYIDGAWEKTACTAHKYEAVVTAPTCTEAGYTTYTCICNDTYVGEEVAALGHSEVVDEAVAPTCTEAGLTEGKHCDVCDEVIVAQEEVAALGHTEVTDDAVAPTCTETGLTEGKHCEVCGEVIVAQEEVPAAGHTEVTDDAVAPTCTETGLTEGKHCEVCGEVIVAQEEVPAAGHTEVTDDAVAPTCTETGLTEGKHCEVCGEVIVAQEEVPAAGHTEVTDDAVAPTCTETGLTEGKHCEVCGEVIVAQEEVPAAGHAWDDGVVTTEPTEESEGVKTYTCGTCGETKTETLPKLVKAGDATGDGKINPLDLTYFFRYLAGWDDYNESNICVAALDLNLDGSVDSEDAIILARYIAKWKGYETIPLENVVYEAYNVITVVQEEIPAPTYASGRGITDADPTEEPEESETLSSDVCGEVIVEQEEVPAEDHSEVVDEAVDATCTETGLTEGKHCDVCGEVIVAQEVVPAAGHSEVVDEAVDATCTEPGLTEGKHCDVCDEVIVAQEEIPATGHSEVVDEAVDATCTEPGLTEGKHCDVCDEVIAAQEEIPATGHAWDEGVITTEPTEDTEGVKTYTCDTCDETKTEEVPKLDKVHKYAAAVTSGGDEACDHVWQEVPAKAPGRTENGYEAYIACEECGEIDGEIVIIPAIGEAEINSYEDFLFNLTLLEEIAGQYVRENPGKNPIALIIKYIRTGVERYNSGSWGIMAGYEDADFAKYVKRLEDFVNAEITDGNYIGVTGLKNLNNFYLPNGDRADIGHVFGAMDITYHNKGSQNHADVSGWAGDLVDLLEVSDMVGVSGTMDEMIEYISENILGKQLGIPQAPSMSQEDIDGDLDALYIMDALYAVEEDYYSGALTEIFANYFTEDLSIEQRAEYFLKNRLDTTGTRAQIRNAVYTEYAGNKLITTLEGTRELTSDNLFDLRKAVCYAFADYVCKLAGDYVETIENPYYEVFASSMSVLAPGITQEAYQATSADGKQMIFYVATADITRDDVHVFANYHNAAPEDGWAMQRVKDQAEAAQKRYGDPDSADYIPNYNVIISTNADGYNMATGEPGGLLVMNGKEWHGIDNGGFFGITKDGKAVIGTKDEYNNIYKDQLADAVGGFGSMLIKDGEIVVKKTDNYYKDRAPRTAIGITKTGKVVIMVLDGRQEPYSCGGSMQEIAQVLFEAGCVEAVNLDGGGSTTFVARQQGEDELTVVNSPSDGAARSVSTSLLMVSTAPSSTAFDHANLVSEYSYATIGTPVEITPVGISATGNITDLPEEYEWAVSNARWATISDDGVFTGLRNGTVDVYLMSDGAIIGSKTMNIVVPENIYFTKNAIDAVYDSTVKLPIAALYEGKQVALNPDDITFTIDNSRAGTINGFDFEVAEESGVKVVKIIAALNADSEIKAVITVNLYRQGENSFDFDKATGGDRLLAWDRVISNSTTGDGISYVAIDTSEKMVTSYVFAMDMSQIPIPAQLEDLVYMLPGADMVDASAWNFLLQLAERVSTLTEVTPVLQFDPNMDVDYSELKILTEYFELESTEFDEEANTLKMKLRWIDQTAAIDPATANPLCLVSGIKLTPKDDANWDSNKRLNVTHAGSISYKIYLRANALYSFAQKADNQQIFGLKPFVNPDLPSESGAYFENIYKEFEDSYTLVNALKNGWYPEDGGFAYYIQGVRMAGGVKEVEGYYYFFNDQGINNGQVKYTGVYFSSSAGAYYYCKNGVKEGGWQSVDGEWYYFDKTTYKSVSGKLKLGGVTYEFDADGKLKSGVWMNVVTGWRYYYGPSYYLSKWQNIDGEWYYFRDGLRVTGMSEARAIDNASIRRWYDFGEDGIARELDDGLYTMDDGIYYLVDGIRQMGLHKVDGDYYFFTYNGPAVIGMSYYAWETHCDLPCDTYAFGLDGKMVNGLAEMSDGIYYYVDGKVNWQQAGLHKINGDYYFINASGKCVTGPYYAWATFCDLPCGNYEFGTDGKMLNGIVEKEDAYYYYVDGKIDWKAAGLHKIDGDYYFVSASGKCVTGPYYAWGTFCDLPCGNYEFGADGKMLQGIVEKEDGHYYYINGQIDWKAAGLHKIDGDYYFVNAAGKCVTGPYYAWGTFCDLPCGNYEFGADGKMLQGIVEKEDGHYYYINGQIDWKVAGLHKIDGDYYFVSASGKCVTGSYYAWATFCDLPCNNYEFGEDGKMLHGFVEREDGLYVYVNGKPGSANPGLAKIDGYYYFIDSKGKCVTGSYYAWATNCDLPCDRYEFDEQGRMLDGFVTKADGIYYYVNGKIGKVGVNYIDGYYYFLGGKGKLVTDQVFWVWETNGLILEWNYVFNELGQIVSIG